VLQKDKARQTRTNKLTKRKLEMRDVKPQKKEDQRKTYTTNADNDLETNSLVCPFLQMFSELCVCLPV
jgi:hypothetical protein